MVDAISIIKFNTLPGPMIQKILRATLVYDLLLIMTYTRNFS